MGKFSLQLIQLALQMKNQRIAYDNPLVINGIDGSQLIHNNINGTL